MAHHGAAGLGIITSYKVGFVPDVRFIFEELPLIAWITPYYRRTGMNTSGTILPSIDIAFFC